MHLLGLSSHVLVPKTLGKHESRMPVVCSTCQLTTVIGRRVSSTKGRPWQYVAALCWSQAQRIASEACIRQLQRCQLRHTPCTNVRSQLTDRESQSRVICTGILQAQIFPR